MANMNEPSLTDASSDTSNRMDVVDVGVAVALHGDDVEPSTHPYPVAWTIISFMSENHDDGMSKYIRPVPPRHIDTVPSFVVIDIPDDAVVPS